MEDRSKDGLLFFMIIDGYKLRILNFVASKKNNYAEQFQIQ